MPEAPVICSGPLTCTVPVTVWFPVKLFPPTSSATPVRLVPLPPFVTTTVGNCAADMVPLTLLAVMANTAYGAGVSDWNGLSWM